MVAHEHTGQVSAEDREQRERHFSEGRLPALFCSPTMELGVDIRTLNAVHMRTSPRRQRTTPKGVVAPGEGVNPR